ncbi:hypothetical protein AWB75_00967 [Caballeronia catudaia]|uniref:Uncharacterized protein n=1 Tax=Caballeronia catudaia TaxID=1777136 RepID=A0A157ZMF6_9BURK|nr:hypothetical protein [Caballeronia catudaia]SAK46704.1 hypothetical protein AWB75_00967 [Caballeronia catudaia]
MRSNQPVIALLQGLAALLEEERSCNPAFAAKLDALMRPRDERASARPKPKDIDLPDVHIELAARDDDDFRAWLRTQPADVLKAIIRREDLDPARRAAKWKDEKKLANFIADGLHARMSRGSAFIGRAKDPSAPE